jgi:hypothetical protein
MARLRIRLTLWRMMALVAIVAVVMGEVFVTLPRERPRLQHAAMHLRMAEGRLRQANSTFYLLDPKLRQEMRDSSAWHRRRWDEIRRATTFDPKAEARIDSEHRKIDDSIDFDYAQATRSL